MNWQVKYALDYLNDVGNLSAVHVDGDVIKIEAPKQPNVVAAISAEYTVDIGLAKSYVDSVPGLDFLCGYRAECVWEGATIEYLEDAGIGWGNIGTLASAAIKGDANSVGHKTFRFADRLLRQFGLIKSIEREFDRIYRVTLKTGKVLRIGMLMEYEPTAAGVRSLWDRFGRVDVIWCINPNGGPTTRAIEAADNLGCEVVKWEDLKALMKARR
ncbi:MAG: hypothetical protein ACTHLA_08105 [Asticcacaulis sp.]|uniref:hypothetical protein n=1 Tax=Asticcacaulis sp. TaxID=1872648 RepID=UPI003F7C8612